MKTNKYASIGAYALAAMFSDGMARPHKISYEKRETKPKKPLPPKGNRYEYPDGIVIY